MDRRSHFETPPSHEAKGQVHLPHVIHPQFSRPVRATIDLVESEDDELATAQTIRLMSQYAREDSRSPIIRSAAAAAARLAEGNSTSQIAASVWNWIRQRVRFQLDSETARPVTDTPEAAELLIRPVDLLTMPQPAGDCDDQSMLCAALLRALGVDSSFKTVAAEDSNPDLYSHVYVVAHTPDGDLALDCSHGPFAGWEVEPAGKTRLWRIEDMHALGAIDWGAMVKIGTEAGAEIAKARFGQPPAGTYKQGSDGSIYYRQPEGANALSFPGVNVGLDTGASGGSLILIVGAVVLLFALTRNK